MLSHGRAGFGVGDMDETAQGPGYIPLCRASALFPFVNFSEKIGAPVNRLLWDCKLPQQALETPEALFPLASGFRFVAGDFYGTGKLPAAAHYGVYIDYDWQSETVGSSEPSGRRRDTT